MLSRAGREKRTEARVDHEELHGSANGGPDRRDLQVPAREPHARTLSIRPSVRESFLLKTASCDGRTTRHESKANPMDGMDESRIED